MKSLNILVDDLFAKQKTVLVHPEGALKNKLIPGYVIRSTARANVEDYRKVKDDPSFPTIDTIINCLYESSKNSCKDSKDVEVVIAVHGYNTGGADVNLTQRSDLNEVIDNDDVWQKWQKICEYASEDKLISQKADNLFFLGYRWPSENIAGKNFTSSISALPFLLNVLLWVSFTIEIVSLLLFLLWPSPLLIFPIILGVLGFALVFSLVILRVFVYFRDSYRANNYGVNDLVELIRQLNDGLVELCSKNEQFDAQHYWRKHPIKLSFVAHSMGAQVTTQAVKILADAFKYPEAHTDNKNRENQAPSSRVGQVFSLSRLLLVSPDIPVLAITSGRTNFLRSSLKRFEEAYLFSNEGDLALRVASTAANYFSFPAKTRLQGYRLGNVTVCPKAYQSIKSKKNLLKTWLNLIPLNRLFRNSSHKLQGESQSEYGIVNWKTLSNSSCKKSSLLEYLEINVLNQDQNRGLDRDLELDPASSKLDNTPKEDLERIANLFTYFDCTEYKDLIFASKTQDRERKIMILDNQTSPLTFSEYLQLSLSFIFAAKGKVDVHGGYANGKFNRRLMYRLAFVGFREFLDSLLVTPPQDLGIVEESLLSKRRQEFQEFQDAVSQTKKYQTPEQARQIALAYLSWIMEQKQIQTVLSPERFYVDVLGEERSKVRVEILEER